MSIEEKLNNDIENIDTLKNEEINKDEYIAKLNDDLIVQKKKADEYFEHLKRNMADFDNFKKRIVKEKDNLHFTITSDVVEAVLPILDNFESAIMSECSDDKFKNGILMIYTQLKETLEKFGLKEIVSLGEEFDPNLHEAVMHIEDENFKERQIVEVLRKGYKISDKVIRHAMVKVAN
ncbi:MAG: nucleotide exchange factor GrpE [Clostridia bacterium]|nr:nucleotide exchange factor GrpE [Clostridia bacterium]